MTLKAKCACGVKAYASEAAAERALERVKARKLRSVMPKRVVQCWRGQWHLEGARRIDTGPDQNTRDRVKERDDWRCANCGISVLSGARSIQHRVARGDGGTSDPAINSPANLVLLCGTATTGCHGKAESRDRALGRKGFWIENRKNPAAIPVTHAVYGRVLLLDDGTVRPVPDWKDSA